MKGLHSRRAKRLSAAVAFGVCASLSSSTAFGLDQSKTPIGTNHARAHTGPHASTGADIKVGVIEAVDGIDTTKTHLDEDGRLIRNLDFRGLTPQIGAAPGGVGTDVSEHASLVADVIGSSHATYTGVAPGAKIYAAATNNNASILAAIEYYHRADGVGIFNMSLGGPAEAITNSKAHTGVQATLNAAGSTTNITTNPFDFTGQTIPTQLDRVSIRMAVNDGDSGRGLIPPGGGPPPPNDFDFDNLELTLDGINLPFKLNGFRNGGTFGGGRMDFDLTPTQSTALLAQLADNQMTASIRRVADLNDTDSGDNSGNRLTPSNAGGNAQLTFVKYNTNGNSQLALALDRLQTDRDILVIKSAGNTGRGSAQITDPGDFRNGITVGAADSSLTARAQFSSYYLAGDNGTAPDRGTKPEILAPGTSVKSADLIESGTSFAAPHVAGIAALIQKGSEQTPGLPLGSTIDNHLAVKAILLNSARKRFITTPENAQQSALDFPGTANEASDVDYLNADGTLRTDVGFKPNTDRWTPSSWSVTPDGGDYPLFRTTRPLDDEQGVGLADAERALIQLDGGEHKPGSVPGIGWDRNVLGVVTERTYSIDEILTGGTFITATLIWDRPVTVTEAGGGTSDGIFEATDVYADGEFIDLDLELYYLNELIAVSAMFDSSLEHLHFPISIAGETNDYSLKVTMASGTGVPYSLAWWTVPEPSSVAVMLVAGGGMLLRRRRRC